MQVTLEIPDDIAPRLDLATTYPGVRSSYWRCKHTSRSEFLKKHGVAIED